MAKVEENKELAKIDPRSKPKCLTELKVLQMTPGILGVQRKSVKSMKMHSLSSKTESLRS